MTLQDIVMKILKEDPRARDDDLWLTWKVYREYTDIFIPFKDFKKLPRPESISRIRRHIQNKLGLYQGHKHNERMIKAEASRKYWAEVED